MNANYTEEKLLYDILVELKEINRKLAKQEPEITEPAPDPQEEPAKPKFYRKCKKCGAEFDNYGYFMLHMKEHRKDGA